jgi:tetratricopeptide (TPR) repeat protein
VDTADGHTLWAGKVDLRFEDIFEVQDEVAHGIAEAMTARLSGTAATSMSRESRFVPPPEAYALYLQALEQQRRGAREGIEQAMRSLDRAIELAPGYADAWLLRSGMQHSMADGGFDPDPVWYARAEQSLSRALELEPDHAGGLFGRASLQLVRGRKREAYQGFKTLLPRMPNDFRVHHYIAYLFRLCDMLDEALAAELRAAEVEPGVPWPIWGMVRLHTLRSDYAEARRWLEVCRGRFPGHPRITTLEMDLVMYEAGPTAALEYGRVHVSTEADPSHAPYQLAVAMLLLGRRDEARPHVAAADRFAAFDMDFAGMAGALHGLLGERDEAFRHLERAVALGNDTLSLYTDDLLFGPLHDDPRWDPFLAGVRSRVAEYRREFTPIV